ncbi:PREDICTED: dual specificity tyrosine-phosphorylation-regulated kinase 2-like [Polistes dominula]|uniref:dual-specificity kinase n=1 Tax=Polistes dominula TaxID=743375 RepID=A0ABM1J5Q1_POLDO|nr:PREDICTED: dual specificity tyrosine-phosphorylation-regulated kinase 2-like [Polistes dominula]
MISLTIATSMMPLSRANPYGTSAAAAAAGLTAGVTAAAAAAADTILTQQTNESNHLPPLKSTSAAVVMMAAAFDNLKQSESSPPRHVAHATIGHVVAGGGGGGGGGAGGGGASTHLPSLASSTNNSLQNLSGNSDSLNLSLSSHASHNSHSQPNSQSSSPMVKNGRSDGSSSGGGGGGCGGGVGGVGVGSGTGGAVVCTTDGRPGTASGASASPSTVLLPEKRMSMKLLPDTVMRFYMNKLTPYEHHEIFNYEYIYFIGANAKKRPGIIGRRNNHEYDNDQGSYIHVPHDHVAYRYEVLKVIGKGSFGQVVKVYDHKNHEHVALKMIRNEKRFHRQAQEEIEILKKLREQDKNDRMNIIHMFEAFTFRCHTCITFELLSINLYELIKKNRFRGFSLQLVRKFSYSLLLCLDALNKNKIIHCDMKPENVLLKQQGRSGIKVIDFGSSCYENRRVYTYIQSRFYRAPEVILGAGYGMPIDMWSLGCILAELFTGIPLLPGEDEADQLACIIELLGMPPAYLLENAKHRRNFISSKGYPRYCAVTTMADGTEHFGGGLSRRGKLRGPPGSREWKRALKGCEDHMFIDFIRGCLQWDPKLRMTPRMALRHAWLRRRLPKPPSEKINDEYFPPPRTSVTGLRTPASSGSKITTTISNTTNTTSITTTAIASTINTTAINTATTTTTAVAAVAATARTLHVKAELIKSKLRQKKEQQQQQQQQLQKLNDFYGRRFTINTRHPQSGIFGNSTIQTAIHSVSSNHQPSLSSHQSINSVGTAGSQQQQHGATHQLQQQQQQQQQQQTNGSSHGSSSHGSSSHGSSSHDSHSSHGPSSSLSRVILSKEFIEELRRYAEI